MTVICVCGCMKQKHRRNEGMKQFYDGECWGCYYCKKFKDRRDAYSEVRR